MLSFVLFAALQLPRGHGLVEFLTRDFAVVIGIRRLQMIPMFACLSFRNSAVFVLVVIGPTKCEQIVTARQPQ